MLDNLLSIESLTKEDIDKLLKTAEDFKAKRFSACMTDVIVCLMFFENSTRTKCSFDIAVQKLGAKVLNFDIDSSSLSKGETLEDTVENLYAIGVNAIVIRHKSDDVVKKVIDSIRCPMKFINAGTGSTEHPTQALLDFMSMTEKFGDMKGKKVTIVGDIKHSRVAKSNLSLLKKFGADIHLCAPEYFKENIDGIIWHTKLGEAIKDADVVMMLRVQNERFDGVIDIYEYIKNYRLSRDILNRCAPKAIIMHPGPVNRNVEITTDLLLDKEKGKVILEQAKNGIFMRMSVIYNMFNEGGEL
ncbi:MAG: aspartate carbamoyltransferase catalytic subunit [Rickettsiales bacterium]|jgi:aspartate carbamoyltransferase catalytic subunit|nr:aspartate carbamoyltransferase catalytic subunit [Rickettsiales bacterium]